MESKNQHIMAAMLCIGVVVFSFFILGLDKIVVKPLVIKESKINTTLPITLSQQPESVLIEEIVENKSTSEEIQYMPKKSDNKIMKTTNKESEISSKIKQLEKTNFTFSGTGTFYQISPSIKKQVYMSLNLKPIAGTSLEKFEITSGKITLDSLGVTIKQGILVFEKNSQITLSFSTSYDSKTISSISGIYQETLLLDKDKKVNLSFNKQTLQLSPKMKMPFIIDVSGNIT